MLAADADDPPPGLDALRNLLRGIKTTHETGNATDRLRSRVLPTAQNNKSSPLKYEPKKWRRIPNDSDLTWPKKKNGLRRVPADDPRRERLRHQSTKAAKLDPLETPRSMYSSLKLGRHVDEADVRPRQDDALMETGEPATSAALIQDWMESFSREEDGFDSVAVFFETRLREAVVQTSAEGMAVPNRVHSAACCDLLLKLPHIFGRYAPLVTKLVTEIMRCIYKNYDKYLSDFRDANKDKDTEVVPLPRASDLFELTAWFDVARSLQVRVGRLQDELKESSEGAGLAQMFRQRFLLWDDRNLLLRSILFHGWRNYTRTMVAGRNRLKLMRMQYWFDRLWEGIEREREESEESSQHKKATSLGASQQMLMAMSDSSTSSAVASIDKVSLRRSVRNSRRSSKIFAGTTDEAAYGITDMARASSIARAFLGTASNRIATLVALDQFQTDEERDFLCARDVLLTLFAAMEKIANVVLGPSLALSTEFARALSLRGEPPPPLETATTSQPAVAPPPTTTTTSDTEDLSSEPVDYVRWLAFGWGDDQTEGIKLFVDKILAKCPALPNDVVDTLEKLLDSKCENRILATSTMNTATAETQTDGDEGSEKKVESTSSSSTSNNARGGVKTSGGKSGKKISDKDASSSLAMSSACQLIPMLYDRLLEICSGDIMEAARVRIADVAKHALIRRFGIKTVAVNYFASMIRTTQLCSNRDPRIALFRLVFSIDSDSPTTLATTSRHRRSTRKSEDPETAAIATFCEFWHNYFLALKVYESAKMKASSNRKKMREAARVRRRTGSNDGLLVEPAPEGHFESFLRSEEETAKLDSSRASELASHFAGVKEFRDALEDDLKSLLCSTSAIHAEKDVKLTRQGDNHEWPALILCATGQAAVYVKSSSVVAAEDELIAKLDAPFVIGEGRLLTGTPANATIVTTRPSEILLCRLDDFEALMDAHNTALKSLASNVIERAEERVKAAGLAISQEKIHTYREFFTDVDVTRSGKVTLQEVLEVIQARGMKVSARDVERAFNDGSEPVEFLDFEGFIRMCDFLVRRGKRLFDKGTTSDILKSGGSKSYLLWDALVTAVERTWKYTAVHEPAVFQKLIQSLQRLPNERVSDPSYFLPSPSADSSVNTHEPSRYTVVEADDAALAAMQFWRSEFDAKNKLKQVNWGRLRIGRLVHRWVSRVRDRIKVRSAWADFLSKHTKVRDELLKTGAVAYETLIEAVEDAYGGPVTDALGAKLFADFQEAANRVAAVDSEAVSSARAAILQHAAALRIELKVLNISGTGTITTQRRSHMVSLMWALEQLSEMSDSDLLSQASAFLDELDVEVGTKIARIILAARTPRVNAEAAFQAMVENGLVVNGGSSVTTKAQQHQHHHHHHHHHHHQSSKHAQQHKIAHASAKAHKTTAATKAATTTKPPLGYR